MKKETKRTKSYPGYFIFNEDETNAFTFEEKILVFKTEEDVKEFLDLLPELKKESIIKFGIVDYEGGFITYEDFLELLEDEEEEDDEE